MTTLERIFAQPWAQTVLGLLGLLVVALIGDLVTRRIALRAVKSLAERSKWRWDDELVEAGVFDKLARITPTLIVQFGIDLVPGVTDSQQAHIRNIAFGGTLLFGMFAMGAALRALQGMRLRGDTALHTPLKGYIELLRIALYIIGTIIIIAVVIGRSPVLLLSGLGALSAVMMLVFKDTLLGFVASVQLGTNDMVRVGDWIEMPSSSADGFVLDISLHTVKVRNWDATITTIPTWKMINESFRNWRGMFDSGGRRIKRSLLVDASSVRFLTDEEAVALERFVILAPYLERKRGEIEAWNSALGEPGKVPVNQRRLTNIGTFRAYAQAYIEAHPEIHESMMRMVRQMASEGSGVPLEIYCFTSKTAWVDFERIQGDIFDHLFSVLVEFDLRLYQKPAGSDVRAADDKARAVVVAS